MTRRSVLVFVSAVALFALRPMMMARGEAAGGPTNGQTAAAPPTPSGTVPAPADPAARPSAPAVFRPAERAVTTWRDEAAESLNFREGQAATLKIPGAPATSVARCVKLNNYWCIKKAGWNGEIAADAEGHVAFGAAVEGAAVAALLLRRYYVDFHRHSAIAIISRWAPAQCGSVGSGLGRSGRGVVGLWPKGVAGTLRARWLASHSRGFILPRPGSRTTARHTAVADRVSRPLPAPSIAVGLGEADRPIKPITLDALLQASPDAPPSRSMIGQRGGHSSVLAGGDTLGVDGSAAGCSADSGRIASYARAAAAGIKPGPDADLDLFSPDGKPTANLATLMANMARVEIGPLGAKSTLISAGIAEAFRPGRNPEKR